MQTGNYTTTTTTKKPIVIPGFKCIQRSAGIPGVHGASTPMTTLFGCAAMCMTAPTCRAVEWRSPDWCFLITTPLSSSAFRYGSQDGEWFVCARLVQPTTTTTAQGTASTTSFKTTALTTTLSSGLGALRMEQETSSANQDVPDGPGWYPWLAALVVPVLCCAGLAARLFIWRRPLDMHKVHSFSDQEEARERKIKAARGWAMGTDSQGAAGNISPTGSAFGYTKSAFGHSETVSPESVTPESPSERVSHAKSWSESVRTRAFSQMRRTRPLFADNEKPQSATPKPRRHRSTPPGSSAFVDHEDSAGAPKGPAPHFSAAWEGSYGARSSRSGEGFATPSGPRTAADAATDEKGSTSSHRRNASFRPSNTFSAAGSTSGATSEGRRSKSRDTAGHGDFEGHRRSRSAGAGLGDPGSRGRSKTADKAGRSSGRAGTPPTSTPGTPRPTPPPTPPETPPPPPASSGPQHPTRVQQLAEEKSNCNADTPREALSPIALALELAKLRESNTLAVRKRYWKEQCLRWHPDKNVGDEQNATRMFQVLQEKKDWFLSDK